MKLGEGLFEPSTLFYRLQKEKDGRGRKIGRINPSPRRTKKK